MPDKEAKDAKTTRAECLRKSQESSFHKRNAIYKTCTSAGYEFGYRVSGDCAVKLMHSLDDNSYKSLFKFYLGH